MNQMHCAKIILFIGLTCSASAQATPASERVASLINQRLSYMKDVAGYKAAHHLAIEDLAQEDKVVVSAVQQACLQVFSEAVHASFQMAAGVMLMAFILSLLLPESPLRHKVQQ